MSVFNNRTKDSSISQRDLLERKYNNSISNILLVVVFTAVNVVLLAINSNTYFLFSALLPYLAVDYAMYLCGMYPEEYYYGDEIFFEKSYFVAALALAAVMLLIYLLCWFFAKKKKIGWLIFAFTFFCVDTIAMFVLTDIGPESIFDIIFHIWVIFSLSNGILSHNNLKKLSEDEPLEAIEEAETDSAEQISAN